MRGMDKRSGGVFSYVDLEKRVRKDHPPRPIREMANTALAVLSGDFAMLYSGIGRPSIAPEMPLRAMLLQAFYSIRSERQLMERLEFDLLFRWFVGLGVDDLAWDHSTFSKPGFPRWPSHFVTKWRESDIKINVVWTAGVAEHGSGGG